MASKQQKIEESDIIGLKFFDKLAPLLKRMHDDCAIIACMLIALWTGKKPTLRTYEMICFCFCGVADEDELIAHIEKLKSQES